MKNIRVYEKSEYFQFLEVKFSIYLNRRVFVMSVINCIYYADITSHSADQGQLLYRNHFTLF